MRSDLVSLRYGPSLLTPGEKTVIRVSFSIASVRHGESSQWYSSLPTILAQLLSLQELVVNLYDLPKLEVFLAEPAIQSLARRPAITVHATYPQLDKESPLSEKQPQLKGYAQVDPISLQPTGAPCHSSTGVGT